MAMSKKHYEQFAACFQRTFAEVRDIRNKDVQLAVKKHLANLCMDMAEVLAKDNNNFSREHFFTACARVSRGESLIAAMPQGKEVEYLTGLAYSKSDIFTHWEEALSHNVKWNWDELTEAKELR